MSSQPHHFRMEPDVQRVQRERTEGQKPMHACRELCQILYKLGYKYYYMNDMRLYSRKSIYPYYESIYIYDVSSYYIYM